jgi:hypothetical protein
VRSKDKRRANSDPTPNQKQLRFFTILLLIAVAVGTALGFWMLNRTKY